MSRRRGPTATGVERRASAAGCRALRPDDQQCDLRRLRRCDVVLGLLPGAGRLGARADVGLRAGRAERCRGGRAGHSASTATSRRRPIWWWNPTGVDPHGFTDGAAHRAALPAAYQRYALTASDPLYRGGTEDLQMLLRPLFLTSFLIDDQLADTGLGELGSGAVRERVQQDGDRCGVPPLAARGRRAGRPHLSSATRRSSRASASTTARVRYDQIALARSSAR